MYGDICPDFIYLISDNNCHTAFDFMKKFLEDYPAFTKSPEIPSSSFVLLSLKLDVPCFRFLLRYNTSFDIKELLVSYCCTKKWNETQKHLIVPQV